MKNKWLLVVLILVLAGGGFYAYKHKESSAESKIAASLGVKVETGSIEDVVTGQGTLEAKEYVDVGAQVSGQIKKLHVDIGYTVKKGDLIAEIDPKTYESRVAGDEAQLKTLNAQKVELEANIKLADLQNQRNAQLVLEQAVSQQAYEETQNGLAVAQAKLKSLKAQIEQAQSTLDGDKVNLGYTRIYAPMDGTVVNTSIKEGQTINASQTAPIIVQIANLSIMTVRAQVAEADITRLKENMPVYFTTLGAQGRKWNGAVRQILPTPTTLNDVVLYNVLIDVDNKDGSLMTGMTTQNFFVVATADNVPVVPVSALGKRLPKNDEGNNLAYEVTKESGKKSEPVTVMIGLMDRKSAEVKSGLSVGDVVVPPLADAEKPKTGTGGGMRGAGPRL